MELQYGPCFKLIIFEYIISNYTSSNNNYKKPFDSSLDDLNVKRLQRILSRKQEEKKKINRVSRKQLKTDDSLTVREYWERESQIRRPSNNFLKTKKLISKAFQHLRNKRKDFLHKASFYLVKSHDKIVVEDLRIRNMTKSSKGTMETPGKNVSQKSGLNRSLLNQGLSTFTSMLEYKCKFYGKEFIKVNPKFTSQTCSQCFHVDKDSRISQSQFECTECGFKLNADQNASRNILARA